MVLILYPSSFIFHLCSMGYVALLWQSFILLLSLIQQTKDLRIEWFHPYHYLLSYITYLDIWTIFFQVFKEGFALLNKDQLTGYLRKYHLAQTLGKKDF